jgi:hypothetical protein
MNSDSPGMDGRVNELRRDYDRLAGEVRLLRGRGIIVPDDLERHLASIEARLLYLERPDSA